jgi:hypothetical protein
MERDGETQPRAEIEKQRKIKERLGRETGRLRVERKGNKQVVTLRTKERERRF